MFYILKMTIETHPKLDRLYNLRISETEEKLLNRMTSRQRYFLAGALRKQLVRLLVFCPVCGEVVGQCKATCPTKKD
jgi:hypothetical protein